MKYLVTDRALGVIERECRRYPDTETGGILVGFRDDEQAIVTHATGPGPRSERSPRHFIKDTPYLQSVLNLLFQYYQVNYLGVWHKHPEDMPFPSSGDVASAMDEVIDDAIPLDELITPICVMESGQVKVVPYVIRNRGYKLFDWDTIPHDKLPDSLSVSDQWYTTAVGHRRLAQEVSGFKELGIAVEVRKGADGSYRFHAPFGDMSPKRLVMLCANDYPVTPPDVALYYELSNKYEPVHSELLDRWDIDHLMCDVLNEYRDASPTAPTFSVRDTGSYGPADLLGRGG